MKRLLQVLMILFIVCITISTPSYATNHADNEQAELSSGQYDSEMGTADVVSVCIKIIERNITKELYHGLVGVLDSSVADQKILADYDYIVQNEPQGSEGYVARGFVNAAKGQYENALKDCETALVLNPALGEAYFLRAEIYENGRNYYSALFDYNRAINSEPDFAPAYFGRGRIYDVFCQYDKAIKDYSKSLAIQPTPRVYYARADAYYKEHMMRNVDSFSLIYEDDIAITDFKTAAALEINECSRMLDNTPDDVDILMMRGAGYLKNNQYDRAVVDFNKVRAIDPKNLSAASLLVIASSQKKQYEEKMMKIDQVTKALEVNSQDPKLYHERAIYYRVTDQYALAAKDQVKANQLNVSRYTLELKNSPKDYMLYNERGWAYLGIKDYEKALDDFNAAIALETRPLIIHLGRGEAFVGLHNYEAAKKDLRMVYEPVYAHLANLDPKSFEGIPQGEEGLHVIGSAIMTLFAIQKTTQNDVIGQYIEELEKDPQNTALYNKLGIVCLTGVGDKSLAIDSFDKAIAIHPQYKYPYVNRGKVYMSFQSGQSQDLAIADFNAAISLDPSFAEAYINRGVAYHNKGMFDAAMNDFNHAINLSPQNAMAYYAKAQTCEKIGRKPEAIEAYQAVIDNMSEYAQSQNQELIHEGTGMIQSSAYMTYSAETYVEIAKQQIETLKK